MPDARIRFQSPELPPAQAIEAYFTSSREARWFSNDGPCLGLLRERLEAYVGQGVSVIPAANGTLALMAALEALAGARRGRGELVLTPSFTYVATVNAIRWAGFTPLFADVDPDGWHLRAEAPAEAIGRHGDRLAAVMAASTFGAPPAAGTRAAWEGACAQAGVPLIVDSAPGFGSEDAAGRRLGAQGDAEIFSFHATKPFAIGEGGAVCTTSAAVTERVHRTITFGLGAGREVVDAGGLNGKLSELHAATALAVLDAFPAILSARRGRAAQLRERLAGRVAFQAGAERSTWQFVPALAPSPRARADTLARAAEHRVELRTYHAPLHRMAPFAACPRLDDLAVTEDLGARMLSLPMANDLDDAAVDAIVAAVA